MKLTAQFVQHATANNLWDAGNQVLYDLCKAEPLHKRDEIITAKIWLIGRAYSAAIERRVQDDGVRGDRFYSERVAPGLRTSAIDRWLKQSKSAPHDINIALETHHYLTGVFKEISGLAKPSLASKYLHFHAPLTFFIFDSRARKGLRALGVDNTARSRRPENVPCDREYAKFYRQCLKLTTKIEELTGRIPSCREVDKLLLAASDTLSDIRQTNG